MRPLPEPIYRTTKEAAFKEAELMALAGFAVEIRNDGNIFAVVSVESFRQAHFGLSRARSIASGNSQRQKYNAGESPKE